MKKIWKFPVVPMDCFSVDLPRGTQILCAQVQFGEAFMWGVVDVPAEGDPETETRRFRLAGTGHPLGEEPMSYIGTFQFAQGTLVFHLFEVVEP